MWVKSLDREVITTGRVCIIPLCAHFVEHIYGFMSKMCTFYCSKRNV